MYRRNNEKEKKKKKKKRNINGMDGQTDRWKKKKRKGDKEVGERKDGDGERQLGRENYPYPYFDLIRELVRTCDSLAKSSFLLLQSHTNTRVWIRLQNASAKFGFSFKASCTVATLKCQRVRGVSRCYYKVGIKMFMRTGDRNNRSDLHFTSLLFSCLSQVRMSRSRE